MCCQTFLAQKLSSLLTSCSSSEWQNGRKYTISLIRPRNSSLRKWACGSIRMWTRTPAASQTKHVCGFLRLPYLQDGLNHRFLELSGDFDVVAFLYVLWEIKTNEGYFLSWPLNRSDFHLLGTFLSPRLSASFLRLISSASCRSCNACWAMSSLATFDVMMKMASLHSMVFPLPSVRRPCEGEAAAA